MEKFWNPDDVSTLFLNKDSNVSFYIKNKYLQIASILNTLDAKGMNQKDQTPALSIPFLDWLNTYDFSDYKMIEFGSGDSTNYFADRFLSVTSFETNEEWYNHLSKKIKNNVDYRLLSQKNAISGNYDISIDEKTVVIVDIAGDRTYFMKSFFNKNQPYMLFFDNAEWYPDTCQYIQNLGYSEIPFWGIRFDEHYDKKTSVFIKHGYVIPKTKYKHFAQGSLTFSRES